MSEREAPTGIEEIEAAASSLVPPHLRRQWIVGLQHVQRHGLQVPVGLAEGGKQGEREIE